MTFQNIASVTIAIGQADDDVMPEGQIVVTVGSAEVFRSPVLDVGDLSKMIGPMVGLVAAFSRRK